MISHGIDDLHSTFNSTNAAMHAFHVLNWSFLAFRTHFFCPSSKWAPCWDSWMLDERARWASKMCLQRFHCKNRTEAQKCKSFILRTKRKWDNKAWFKITLFGHFSSLVVCYQLLCFYILQISTSVCWVFDSAK